jgi:hypothetical protein
MPLGKIPEKRERNFLLGKIISTEENFRDSNSTSLFPALWGGKVEAELPMT